MRWMELSSCMRNLNNNRIFLRYSSNFENSYKHHREAIVNIKKSKHYDALHSGDGKVFRKNNALFGLSHYKASCRDVGNLHYGCSKTPFLVRTMCYLPEEISDLAKYEEITNETLESMSEYFEEIFNSTDQFPEADVSLSAGVLTVHISDKKGVYVINRQTPNRQIWLSSPFSGPKRYDWVNGHWVYKHDNISLHDLLSEEMSRLLGSKVDFTKCSYGTPRKAL